MDLSINDIKPTRYRRNTAFLISTSHNFESPSRIISASDTRLRQPPVTPTVIQPVKLPTYQDIEAAYLERGIRIRVTPTRPSQSAGGRKSAPNLQRHSAFVSRDPTRTSSVLHYTVANLNEPYDSRPFSALQQTSSDDFEQGHTHNVSYAQSSQVNDETPQHETYLSPSIVVSEHSNSLTPEKVPLTNNTTSSTSMFDNDPDLAYMSMLLRKQNGDAFTGNIEKKKKENGIIN
jgi:hypothetical protein